MAQLKLANRQGIPCLEVVSINVTASNVIFNIAEHPWFRENFQGLFLIRNLQTFTAPSSPLPAQLATAGVAGSNVNITNVGSAAITSADLAATGIYLFFYDRPTNVLQLISRHV